MTCILQNLADSANVVLCTKLGAKRTTRASFMGVNPSDSKQIIISRGLWSDAKVVN